MTEEKRKERLARLKARVAGQPERELRTQFRAHVAEIAELEALAPGKRKADESQDRKREDDRNNRGK